VQAILGLQGRDTDSSDAHDALADSMPLKVDRRFHGKDSAEDEAV
jgi:hypothetical protein